MDNEHAEVEKTLALQPMNVDDPTACENHSFPAGSPREIQSRPTREALKVRRTR